MDFAAIGEALAFELILQPARSEGLRVQSRPARGALAEHAPKHPLLKPTGRKYESGKAQIAFQSAFDDAIDKNALELELADTPVLYRMQAL